MEKISRQEIQSYKADEFEQFVIACDTLLTRIIARRQMTNDEVLGYMTRDWVGFNQHFGGARGELVVATADTNVGKSTFVRSWLYQMVENNVGSMMLSLEDSVDEFADALVEAMVHKDIRATTDEDVKEIKKTLERWPLHYLDYSGVIKESFALKTIRYAAEVLGTKFVVIDHLDYIDKVWSGRNEAYVIGDFMRKLSGLALMLKVCVCLVVHPAKRSDKSLVTKEVGIDELKGSSSIKQEAASVLGLHQPDPESPNCYIRFLKIRNRRFARARKGRLWFTFDRKSSLYKELNGGIEWGE